MMGPMSPGSFGGDLARLFPVLLAVVIIVGLIVLALVTWRRRQDERQANKRLMARTRGVVRQQHDIVADDILKLEDSVRAAGNREALAHFRNATVTYAAVVGELDTADNVQEVANLARRLDAGIWQLGAVEAILDGSPVPPELAPGASQSRPPLTRRYLRSSDRRRVAPRRVRGVVESTSEEAS